MWARVKEGGRERARETEGGKGRGAYVRLYTRADTVTVFGNESAVYSDDGQLSQRSPKVSGMRFECRRQPHKK